MAGLPSNTAANRSSARTLMRKSGRQSCSARMAGVSRTRSPSDRRRISRTSAPRGSSGKIAAADTLARRAASFVGNAGFVHEHHGDIFANRVNAAAGGALEAVLIGGEFHRRLIERANQNIEQFLRNGHQIPPCEL